MLFFSRTGLLLILVAISISAVACNSTPPAPTPPPAAAPPPKAPKPPEPATRTPTPQLPPTPPNAAKPPEPPPLTPLPIEPGSAPTVPANNPRDFSSLLDQAVSLVTRQYPQAKLYEADGSASGESGGSTAESVQQWRFVFQNANNTTVMLNYGEGNFQPPQLVAQPWLEDRVITLPLKRSLPDAVVLLKQNGYTEPFTNVTLRYPLYPGVTEPSFIFTIPSRNFFVFVGVNTGQVTAQGQ